MLVSKALPGSEEHRDQRVLLEVLDVGPSVVDLLGKDAWAGRWLEPGTKAVAVELRRVEERVVPRPGAAEVVRDRADLRQRRIVLRTGDAPVLVGAGIELVVERRRREIDQQNDRPGEGPEAQHEQDVAHRRLADPFEQEEAVPHGLSDAVFDDRAPHY